MKQLVLVRHGHYGSDRRLSKEGAWQMRRVAEKIQLLFKEEGKLLVLSSTAPRADDSAKVLAEALGGVPIELHLVLWSDNGHPEDMEGFLGLVRARQDQAEVIILVTHKEYVGGFPRYFGKEVLGTKIPSLSPSYAEGCVIQCSSGTFDLISYKP